MISEDLQVKCQALDQALAAAARWAYLEKARTRMSKSRHLRLSGFLLKLISSYRIVTGPGVK